MTLSELFPARNIRFDHHPDGFGLGTGSPRLSWRYASKADGEHERRNVPGENWAQKGYKVDVQILEPGVDGRVKGQHRLEVASDNSLFEPWPAPALRSRERARVSVIGHNSSKKVFADQDTQVVMAHDPGSSSSPAAKERPTMGPSEYTEVEVGLLEASDWKARFVTSTDSPEPDNVPHRPTLYRKVFTLDGKKDAESPSKGAYARLYITSLGIYAAYINGTRVGDHHMAPGWTSYHYRVQYQTFDVSDLLKPGKNVIAIEVAEGWYAGRLLWEHGLRNLYGDKPAFIAQLELHNPGESLTQILSDDTWTSHPSPRQSASIYNGETYDAREILKGWDQADFKESSAWKKTRILDFDFSKTALVATDAPPVRITGVVKPIKVFTSPSGKTLVDFGQNLVGRVSIRGVQKPAGHLLTIRHAEVLENEELGTRPLRDAEATDRYIFSGNEAANHAWAPHFTFHGFRYIELTGWSASDTIPPSADTLSAVVIGSDMHRTGHFQSSHKLVNQLHSNVVWSMRGNFLSVPTDCPQRDERLGWTGDIQVFTPTATFLYSAAGFLSNWLRDLSIDQLVGAPPGRKGIVPVVVPDVLHNRIAQDDLPVAVWDDAAILVPWYVYRASGDAAVLKRQFPSMEAHLRTAVRRGPDGLWDPSVWQYGDWLDPNAPPDDAALARTDSTLVADAYLAYVTQVVSRVAVAIGHAPAAAAYQAEADALKAAFGAKYVAPSGLVVGDSQTALALAICFDLLGSPAQEAAAGARLAKMVRLAGCKVATGFAGTPLVLPALTKTGNVGLAYEMLLTQACPSWLYPVTMGATTIWERWDSMLPDGRINPGSMTSFNHYALGSVADWLHTVVGGVEMLEPGWRTFRVRPRPGVGLDRAEVRFESPLGLVGCKWVVESGVFRMRVEVPPNSRALVVMPGQTEEEGVWRGCGVCEVSCEIADQV